jgi:hypothetical protein
MNQQISPNQHKWSRMLAVGFFILVSTYWLLTLIVPDWKHRIATAEIVVLILIPLITLYVRSKWSSKKRLANIVVLIPIWFLSYSLLHELSHLITAFLLGQDIIAFQLMPNFWEGDFASGGWTQSQLFNDWRDTLPGLGPYLRDIIFVAVGFIILKAKRVRNSFVVGLLFVLFCLSPLFDIVDNYLNGYIVGHSEGNDFIGTAMYIGATWTNIIAVLFIAMAACVSFRLILIYKDFPE